LAPTVADVLLDLARYGYVQPRAKTDAPTAEPPPRERPQATVVSVEDLYAVLGVERGATAEDIHRAYRRLARELHPDVNTSADAPARFAHVSKAYSVLKDPEKRRRYDELAAGCSARHAA